MKYIFIAGLEHSGSTLINHLICQDPYSIGLGEVAQFFSPQHMKDYLSKWGRYNDARLCSCGKDWSNCEFWKEIINLSGIYSEIPLVDKYARLVQHIKNLYTQNVTIVDSSKNFSHMKMILDNRKNIGLDEESVHVVLMIKDVRSFTTSIVKKEFGGKFFIDYLKTFNWWLGVNQEFIRYLQSQNVNYTIVLYEKFCINPGRHLEKIAAACNLDLARVSMSHTNSHIAMGNKNFIMRNRDRIEYDIRWFLDDKVSLAYLMHFKARKFNKMLYVYS